MTRGRKKLQPKGRARVRQILLREWDPLEIGNVPEASDEYDEYADKAYVILMDEKAGVEDLFLYLHGIAARHMGLERRPGLGALCVKVAQTLVSLRPEFKPD